MQLNEHFKNVSMSQSHYLKHNDKSLWRKEYERFSFTFSHKAFILTF